MKKKLALSLLLSTLICAETQWKPEKLTETVETIQASKRSETLRTIEEAAQEEAAAAQKEEQEHAQEHQAEEVHQETIVAENNDTEEQNEQDEQEVLDVYQMLEHIKQHILQLHPHHEQDIKIISHALVEMLEIINSVSVKSQKRSIDFSAYNDLVDTEERTKSTDQESNDN